MGVKTKLGISMAVLTLITGCGNKGPTCADPQAVELVKSIYLEQFEKEHSVMSDERQRRVQYTAKDTVISVDRITTESADDSVGKKTCNARLIATVPAEAVPSSPETKQHLRNIYDRQGVVMEGNAIKSDVTYMIQRTEDKGQLLVTLSGFKPLMSYFHDVAMLRVWNKGVPTSMTEHGSAAVNWSAYIGKHPADILKDPTAGPKIRSMLGEKFAVLEANIAVASGMETVDGNLLVGTGIAPHDGGTNEAIMAFNTVTNAYYVVLFTDGQNLNAFGVNDMKDLPAPLKQWVIDKGGKL